MITYQALAQEAIDKWHIDAARIRKAVEIVAENHSIYNSECAPGEWDVRSQTALNSWYHVNTHARTCTCTDSQRGNVCKHRLAVWLLTEYQARTYAPLFRVSADEARKRLFEPVYETVEF